METLILLATSPLVLAIIFFVFVGIAVTVRLSAVDYSVLSVVEHAASGMGTVFILLLAGTFLDINVTCQILLKNNLLQFEFLILTFTTLAWLIDRYIRNFDPPYDPRRNPRSRS